MKDRSIHLIDVENLAGFSSLMEAAGVWVGDEYRRVVSVQHGDQVVVAASHRNAFAAAAAFPGARLLVKSGKDGADLKLLEVLTSENLDQRFSSIFLGSGDGIFANEAARHAALGVTVAGVSLPGHASTALQMACQRTIYFGGAAFMLGKAS